MSNHFTAMGLPVREREDLSRVIGSALRGAVVEPAGFRQTLAVWREHGAGVDVLLRKARFRGEPTVECATPQFDGQSRQSVRVTGVMEDGDCAGCSVVTVEVLDGGEMLYPLAVAPARVAALRKWFGTLARSGEPVEASIVFVAEDIEVYADEAAFDATQGEPGFAAESLIPVGLFTGRAAPEAAGAAWPGRAGPDAAAGPDRDPGAVAGRAGADAAGRDAGGGAGGAASGVPTPAALVHGVVTAARVVTSAAFGAAYAHLTVRTLGGEFDVVMEKGADVAPGNVVAVQAWVCGQIGEVR